MNTELNAERFSHRPAEEVGKLLTVDIHSRGFCPRCKYEALPPICTKCGQLVRMPDAPHGGSADTK